MNTTRPCGCKGRRSCLICEKEFGISRSCYSDMFKQVCFSNIFLPDGHECSTLQFQSVVFCPDCNQVYPGWDVTAVCAGHPYHGLSSGVPFSGILVVKNFLTVDEGIKLQEKLDDLPWQDSQSGRRKQNFGPKTNFKKMKMQNGDFHGFPEFTKFVQDRFKEIPLLKKFQTIEQCTLEYDYTKGSSIDPHIDDCWVWGERVVTVNCLGESVLTLSPFEIKDPHKYNLQFVPEYENDLIEPIGSMGVEDEFSKYVIRIPMPRYQIVLSLKSFSNKKIISVCL